MNFLAVMNQVLVIFLIIIIGTIATRLGYISREVRRGLNLLLLNIAIPAMVIKTFDTEIPAAVLKDAWIVLVFALASHLLTAVLSQFLFRRYPERTRSVLSFTTVFTNCGFMGYPLLESVFGTTGVFYASIYIFAFNLFIWTYGQMLFTGAKDLKTLRHALLNAGTLSVLIGLVLLLTPLKLPPALAQTVSVVGAMTTPVAMIVTGAMLASVRLRDLFQGFTVYYATILRLLILPTAALLILHLLGTSASVTAICTLLIGLPAAGNTVIFADKLGGDAILASRIVVISTALSIVTIPLLVLFVQ